MTQTEWAHLPNSKHIDWVLASLKAHPEKWDVARNAARGEAREVAWYAAWYAAKAAAWDAAWDAALDAARYAAWYATRTAAWDAAWDAALDAAYYAAGDAATGAILALIAHDDCAYMIESEIGELKIIAAFGDPRAILLLPACIAYNETKELV